MSLENYLFHNNESPKKGCLLIAEPFLDDLFFGRSVILLCENNKEGSFGFVLNNYRAIDFNSIDCLNESNNKVIDLATMASKELQNSTHSTLLSQIKLDHHSIEFKLKQLTEKNLIIIPKSIYKLKINE